MRILFVTFCAAMVAILSPVVQAKPVTYDGSIELRAPVWSTADSSFSSHWNNLELAGNARVHNLLGPVVLFVNGEHTFSQAGTVLPENKLRVGGELPLTQNLCVFTYWDRRFAVDVDRVFVGVRLNFSGKP